MLSIDASVMKPNAGAGFTALGRLALWGKSVAVRLPAQLLRENGWHAGQAMQFECTADGAVLLKPAPQKPDLDFLLTQVTDENMPDEADIQWGVAKGSEAW